MDSFDPSVDAGRPDDAGHEPEVGAAASDGFDGHQDASFDAEAMQRLLLTTDTLTEFLDELAVAAARATAHHCAITIRGVEGGADYTVASSSELALQLDEAQYTDGQGPCLEALRTARPVVVNDMVGETRWGPYPAHAVRIGARSSLSYPLLAREQSIGALNLYSTQPFDPGPELRNRAALLAGQAGGALALALRLAEQDQLISTLRVALRSRSGIDQAIGILMAQQRCDARTAFDLLRAASQGRNIKLRDLAAQIVDGLQRDVPGAPPRRY